MPVKDGKEKETKEELRRKKEINTQNHLLETVSQCVIVADMFVGTV